MPLFHIESSLPVPLEANERVLSAVIGVAAELLEVGRANVRARLQLVERDDITVYDEHRVQPWVVVYAHIKAGRSPSVKAALARRLFEVLGAELGVPERHIRLLVRDYAPEDWIAGT